MGATEVAQAITFRPLSEGDLPRLTDWLNRQHLRRFYQPTAITHEDVTAKCRPRISGEAPTRGRLDRPAHRRALDAGTRPGLFHAAGICRADRPSIASSGTVVLDRPRRRKPRRPSVLRSRRLHLCSRLRRGRGPVRSPAPPPTPDRSPWHQPVGQRATHVGLARDSITVRVELGPVRRRPPGYGIEAVCIHRCAVRVVRSHRLCGCRNEPGQSFVDRVGAASAPCDPSQAERDADKQTNQPCGGLTRPPDRGRWRLCSRRRLPSSTSTRLRSLTPARSRWVRPVGALGGLTPHSRHRSR